MTSLRALVLVPVLALSSCKTTPQSEVKDDVTPSDAGGLKLCAGVRGNGNLITAHWGSLARISEHYGELSGYAGGSSASLTGFLYESMTMSPAIRECGGQACNKEQTGVRLGLLLKSMFGYLDVLGQTEEADAAKSLFGLYLKLTTPAGSSIVDRIASLNQTEVEKGWADFNKLLQSKDVKRLVNPELVKFLLSNDPRLRGEGVAAVRAVGEWDVKKIEIFFRPGLVNFAEFGALASRIGEFYAGWHDFADKAGFQAWVDACAEPGKGKAWPEIAALPAGGSTCGAQFTSLLKTYRAKLKSAEDAGTLGKRRVDEQIGAHLPTLVSTSILVGDATKQFDEAYKRYLAGQAIDFHPKWDDIRFGYWGRAADLQRVGSDPNGFADAKTKKFVSLGEATWRHALSFSPAEPSLARILPIDAGHYSAGGWSDLHPTLVLKNLGCDQVLYVSRQGGESPFAMGVAEHLGMTQADRDALYRLDANDATTPSSFAKSLQNASVWCTDWNSHETLQLAQIFVDTYNAPLEVRDAGFAPVGAPYPNAKDKVDLYGCTPGLSAPQPQ